ncbi:MAG: hypothetical protein R3D43_14405 [Tepidamorphaceae bacterium]|nr:hypothetical protein [Rhodobiaceae bacterium]MCC0048753.1 hypothetical protein [Rhodobiaceae bacterium]
MKHHFLIDFPSITGAFLMGGLQWYLAVAIGFLAALYTFERDIEDAYSPMRAYGDPEDANFDALPAFAGERSGKNRKLQP